MPGLNQKQTKAFMQGDWDVKWYVSTGEDFPPYRQGFFPNLTKPGATRTVDRGLEGAGIHVATTGGTGRSPGVPVYGNVVFLRWPVCDECLFG